MNDLYTDVEDWDDEGNFEIATTGPDGLYTEKTIYIQMTEDTTVTALLDFPAPKIKHFCVVTCLDQDRTEIGIGEEVVLVTLADDEFHRGGKVDWVVEIPGISPLYFPQQNEISFSAPRYIQPYTISVGAALGGCLFYLQDFSVLVPDGDTTEYHDWYSELTDEGEDLMGGQTIFKVKLVPNNVCFKNVSFREEDAVGTSSWPNPNLNPALEYWSTDSGGAMEFDCNNVWYDQFTDGYFLPDVLFVNGVYEDFDGLFDFDLEFQDEGGTWGAFASVESRVGFWEESWIDPEDGFMTRFRMEHMRNSVPGIAMGSWEDN